MHLEVAAMGGHVEGSEALDAELIDLAEGILAMDADWRVTRVNKTQERISGRPRSETLGRTYAELWPEAATSDSLFYRQYERCMRERVPVDFEAYWSPRDAWMHLEARPLQAGGIVIFFRDITQRRRAEDATRASEERLRLLVDHAPTAIALFDRNLCYLAHSQRLLADFRLPDASLLGRHHYDVFPDIPEPWRASYQRALAGELVPPTLDRFERADGSREWIRWEVAPWRRDDGEVGGVVLFSENLTALKAAEASLAAQKKLLQSIVDGMPTLVAALDREGRFELVNDAGARALGAQKESVIGRRIGWLQPPEQQEWLHGRLRELIRTGTVQSDEVEVSQAAGPHHLLVTRFPLRDPSGEMNGIGIVCTDISQLKRTEAELRQSEASAREMLAQLEKERALTRHAEERLRQAQKMESVGQLAGGVAHDFNNLLTVILGGTEQLLSTLSPRDPLCEDLRQIEAAGQRAAGLTRQLLAFGRKQVLEPRIVDLNVLVRDANRLLERLLGEDIELQLVLEPTAHPCSLDPGQFEQVLLNLAVNARDAMPDGGNLLIETANVTLDETYAFDHPAVVPGNYVRLSVTDTGHGMTDEVRARLFEPFFTTKEVGRGTGLGLATVYGIVRQSGGAIWVYSEVGQGTTFKIYFPVAGAAAGAIAPTVASSAPSRGHETILLVEDDAQVRATVARMLRRNGYHVIEAANGGEALLICEQHGGTLHLLLTDVVMPKLNGRKVAERLRAVRPTLRVLFMSGYTENAIVHHGVLDPGIDFLAKPIRTEALLVKVREVLDRDPPSSH